MLASIGAAACGVGGAIASDCGPDCVEHASALFNCKTPPSISIGDYIIRICQYSNSSFESFVIALAYVDRFQLVSPRRLACHPRHEYP